MSLPEVETANPEYLEELGLVGKIPAAHCHSAPQFCYYLYIPTRYRKLKQIPLLVAVHGSGRDAASLRGKFVSLAESRGCAVLAPLFPTGLIDPNDTNNYKLVKYQDVRYDEALLAMVDEVKSRYPRVNATQFLLWGFSGGGQFVHRFAYLHPKRLLGLAIGAPGTITPLDHTLPYPSGVKDLAQIFELTLDWTALNHVPTLFVAGEADTDKTHAIARGRNPPEDYKGRCGLAVQLAESWAVAGARTQFVGVPGAGHEEAKMIPSVVSFFETLLGDSNPNQATL